jgi:hypothetical protein
MTPMTDQVRGEDPETFEVTVWDIVNGDVVKKLWRATQEDLDDLERLYGDDPQYEIVVEDH